MELFFLISDFNFKNYLTRFLVGLVISKSIPPD